MRRVTGIRGSGGVAILFKTQLRPHISVVRIEEQAQHMWIRIRLLDTQLIFISVCYFPLDHPSYAHDVTTEGHDPYETLHYGIMEFSMLGDILLLGDFNARTCTVGLLNFEDEPILVPELDPTKIGIMRYSADASHVIGYGHHLHELRTAHNLII